MYWMMQSLVIIHATIFPYLSYYSFNFIKEVYTENGRLLDKQML